MADTLVDGVVLVVKVGEFGLTDSGCKNLDIEGSEEAQSVIDQEKESVFVVDALEILDVSVAQLQVGLPQIVVEALNERRERREHTAFNFKGVFVLHHRQSFITVHTFVI